MLTEFRFDRQFPIKMAASPKFYGLVIGLIQNTLK